jgi:hypothetical protein
MTRKSSHSLRQDRVPRQGPSALTRCEKTNKAPVAELPPTPRSGSSVSTFSRSTSLMPGGCYSHVRRGVSGSSAVTGAGARWGVPPGKAGVNYALRADRRPRHTCRAVWEAVSSRVTDSWQVGPGGLGVVGDPLVPPDTRPWWPTHGREPTTNLGRCLVTTPTGSLPSSDATLSRTGHPGDTHGNTAGFSALRA